MFATVTGTTQKKFPSSVFVPGLFFYGFEKKNMQRLG